MVPRRQLGSSWGEIKAILALEMGGVTCARTDRLASAPLSALRDETLKLRQLERFQQPCVGKPREAPYLLLTLLLRSQLRG